VQLCWRTFGGQWPVDPDTAPVAVQVTDFLRTYTTTMMDYRHLTSSTMRDRRGSRERGVQVLMYAQYLLKNQVSCIMCGCVSVMRACVPLSRLCVALQAALCDESAELSHAELLPEMDVRPSKLEMRVTLDLLCSLLALYHVDMQLHPSTPRAMLVSQRRCALLHVSLS
jgi:hypothetical protein